MAAVLQGFLLRGEKKALVSFPVPYSLEAINSYSFIIYFASILLKNFFWLLLCPVFQFLKVAITVDSYPTVHQMHAGKLTHTHTLSLSLSLSLSLTFPFPIILFSSVIIVGYISV